jgi:VanZ family protein
MQNLIIYQLPWIAMMIAITIQSAIIKHLPLPSFANSDKFLHFFVYGLLGMLAARGMLFAKSKFLNKHYLLFAFLLGSTFGLSDEIHQYFVPGRCADVYDWLADSLGILVFAPIYYKLIHQKMKYL